MAEYRKYLFDNFVINEGKKKEASVDEPLVDELETSNIEAEEEDDKAQANDEEIISENENIEFEPEPEPEPYIAPIEEMFTQDDIDNAVAKAKEDAYAQGLQAAQESELNHQNLLLEEIKNQLSLIFADAEKQNDDQELSALRFMAAALHKLFPTLEKIDGVSEIKSFLDENFAKLSARKSLAFFLNPDMAKKAAPLIQKAAEHNDFEGKISIHKDENLGFSDCRIEWEEGYVERNTTKLLERLENLLSNNQQERENG